MPEAHHQCTQAVLQAKDPLSGSISDLSQQVWVLQGQTIVAVPRSDSVAPVMVTIFPCKFPESLDQGKGTPIYFAIQNPEMCLCCEAVGGQPALQLKEEKILDLYNEAEPVRAFLFYHVQLGSTSTFESVAFPGWFLASADRGQPIFLTSDQGTNYNTAFNLHIRF
ncbi:PREDICTED: interleukin-36 gamma [Hipposideros armiger]|uniref:Interleukin-1 n=1 Tax=Hipposideros armiger TaxID=186990 RepID=A0A8B7SYC2_HIPAR|nr:PREDICTED: interleukin-36 gamma [Hipposideros armiger]